MQPKQSAKTFRDLAVWQKAHKFVLATYEMTGSFPRQETYGLVSQMRRAAVSVPANIAEGFKRQGKLDKLRMMNIAQGSIEESRYYLILAQDLGYAKTERMEQDLDEVSRILDAYRKAIQTSIACRLCSVIGLLSSVFFLLS